MDMHIVNQNSSSYKFKGPYVNKTRTMAMLFSGEKYNQLALMRVKSCPDLVVTEAVLKKDLRGSFVDCSFSPSSEKLSVITHNPVNNKYVLMIMHLQGDKPLEAYYVIQQGSACVLGWGAEEKTVITTSDLSSHSCSHCEHKSPCTSSVHGYEASFDFDGVKPCKRTPINLKTFPFEKCAEFGILMDEPSKMKVWKSTAQINLVLAFSANMPEPYINFNLTVAPSNVKRSKIMKEDEDDNDNAK